MRSLLVQEVREAWDWCLLELYDTTGLELAAEPEEESRDLRASVELGLDAGEGATLLPEGAVRSGATSRRGPPR